jgi:perosamine synthetase
MFQIPVYQPTLAGREREYVLDCLDSNWISSKGKYVTAFESAFAEQVGNRYAVAMCNGTIALHAALLALGVGPEDEVLVPTLTYVASVNAITYTGATPVFVDSLRDTWQIDPSDIERRIGPRTKAIIAVHVYGQPCQIDRLREIATHHNLFLIEDCAEAVGSYFGGKHVGTNCDIATYSFYGNKTITTGEGGMVVTSDKTLANRLIHLRSQGLAAYREYWHDVVGYNFRMTNICAAIGLAQLEQLDGFLRRKRDIAVAYEAAMDGTALTPHREASGTTHSFWMCSVLVADPMQRDIMREHLKEAGIETRPVFYPVHTMPMYQKRFERHPIAEDLAWRGVNLPSWPGMSDEQIATVTDSLKAFAAII